MQLVLPKLALDSDLALSASPTKFTPNMESPSSPPAFLIASSFQPFGSPLHLGRQRLDAFDIVCLIGKGGFGKVFMVRHKATCRHFAMKVMEKEVLIRRKAVEDAHAERNILAIVGQQDIPFIVRLHVAFQTSKRVYLVMDFASGGELMFHLRREAMLSEQAAKFYAAELLVALESLHDMNIVHRDIKPENVLLDGEGHLVLTDFGLAKEVSGLEHQNHSWCGSEDYMAPEIVARASHAGKPADYWAFGVFLYDCLCGQPPFSPLHEKGKVSRKRLHERILKCKYKLPAYLSPECHNLLRRFLTKDPSKRLCNPEEVRSHPWFAGIDWEAVRHKQLPPPIIPSHSSPTACFSPSLTKVDYSAPHSPLTLTASATAPVPVAGSDANNSYQATLCDSIWQGFSFVAPGMELHFELMPSANSTTQGGMTSASADAAATFNSLTTEGACFVEAAQSPPAETANNDWEDPLAAELLAFSVDAVEAVEIKPDDDH